jgi:hypothetical protein
MGAFVRFRAEATGTRGERSLARKETEMGASSTEVKEASSPAREYIQGFHGVRYQTKNVSRAVAFYTNHLGFKVEHQQLPGVRCNFIRTSAHPSQRSWRLRLASNVGRTRPRARRLESRRVTCLGPREDHCCLHAGRTSISQRNRSRTGWEADPAARYRRQPHRVV